MSETQTATLTDFLLARIAEDEAAAKGAPDPFVVTADGVSLEMFGLRIGGHFDPARVLAECEAKRRIVEECEASASLAACQPRGSYDEGITTGLLAAMHALAAVYADHPDYRAEWAL